MKFKTLIVMLILFSLVSGIGCKSSKKSFPWWLFLLGGQASLENGYSGGGNSDSGGGPIFIPASGELDESFGQGSGNGSNNDAREKNQYVSQYNFTTTIEKMDMVVDSSGRILVAGTACVDRNSNGSCDSSIELDFIIVRFDSYGLIDNSFGSNGVKIINVSDVAFNINKRDCANSLTLDNEGNIYVTGYTRDGSDISYVAVVKLDSNGNIVTSFGSNGVKTFRPNNSSSNYGTKISFYQESLYVGGYFWNGFSRYDIFLTRMDLNGIIDSSFGSSGYYIFNSDNQPDYLYSFAIKDNYIYIPHVRIDNSDNIAISIRKLNMSGVEVSSSPLDWGLFRGRDILLDSDNNLYVGGYVCEDNNRDGSCDGKYNFKIMKFDSSLNYITSEIDFGPTSNAYGQSITLQPDGKILLAGWASDADPNYNFALIRVDSNLILDPTFGPNHDGKFTWDHQGKDDRCYSIKVLRDGKILMAGYTTNTDNSRNITVIGVQ